MSVAIFIVVAAVMAAVTVVVQRRTRPIRGLVGFLMGIVGLGSVLGYVFHKGHYLDPMFAAMRMWSYGLFLHLPLMLLGWAWLERRARPRIAVGLAVAAALNVAVGVDAFLYEPTALEVTERTLEIEGLTRPLTVGVLADIQTDAPGEYEARAIREVLAREPDLVLLPGDYVHGGNRGEYAMGEAALRTLIAEVGLEAPLGVYAVPGNVDTVGRWHTIFDGTQVTTATATRVFRPTPELSITALSLEDSFDVRLKVPTQPGLHIVVGHGPDFALGDVDADLLVAGHTHGGQVVIPGFGPLVTLSQVPRDWASGYTRLRGDRHLYVSRGVGLERGMAPRVRFFCRPEAVVLRLVPKT